MDCSGGKVNFTQVEQFTCPSPFPDMNICCPCQEGANLRDFSYNTGKLRCPVCDGTGGINLDVQFLPDVTIPCPECRGSRYGKDAYRVSIGRY